jgi:acyl-CoA thioesterase
MDPASFLGLEPTDDPTRFRLPVTPGISTGAGFLYGGCGLGAGIAAMEAMTGRPIVWATAQYLSYAKPPSVIDIEVQEVVRGHQISQARAIARVGDTEILAVHGALGLRPMEAGGEWAIRPEVPGPDECPPRLHWRGEGDDISSRLDVRIAQGRGVDEMDGTPGDGRSVLWARMPNLHGRFGGGALDISGAALGILGDYVPFGVGQALGARAGGNSLDNTLRVACLVPTEWVLLDIRIHAIANGFAHGLVHQWAEDGTLLATASQSTIVRFWKDA